ncbi:hypothetical protein [Mycoplasma bradburyae]|uniref:Haemagglutinin Mycoplasma domain-containing protein n=1 Tax=Mycoplasma bradburyae TaxID=2963128 RepID=A0ABT5GBC7_9MOLU|nr:hypothetical protein [Mycoplasma bradburyae]MDC4182099.1 hypothetical protein [Mycoplasma bradburyae]UTS69827.1 hypothetical protein NMG68_02255 [Mycoplasma bradburyae]
MKQKKYLKIFNLLGITVSICLMNTSCAGIKISESATSPKTETNPLQPESTRPNSNNPNVNGNSDLALNNSKNELINLLKTEDSNISLYKDYSKIKNKLQNAYNSAKNVNNDSNAKNDVFIQTINELQLAINSAAKEKTAFDNSKHELVDAYNALKNTLSNKENDLRSIGDDSNYQEIKNQYESLYSEAELIITNTLQDENLTKEKIQIAKNNIIDLISDINDKKAISNEYLNFKKFSLSSENFIGDFLKTQNQASNWRIVSFSSNLSDPNIKFATRKIDKLPATDNLSNITDVAWIYDLRSQNNKSSSYNLKFKYYSGSSAVLYFPYKTYTSSQNSNNLGLQYKLNNGDLIDISSNISDAQIGDIKIAKINLNGLIFGENIISFSAPLNKQNPMIGNMYIAKSETEESINKINDNLFGNEKVEGNPNTITVNFVKGYGMANKIATNLTKFNGKFNDNEAAQTQYLIGYLGSKEGSGNDSQTDRYYIFYVNASVEGTYKISGFYNSGENRGLSFWKDNYGTNDSGKKAKFHNLNSGAGNWTDKLKMFNEQQKTNDSSASLNLTKGLNKIIVSGLASNSAAPNLGNITFTLDTTTQPAASSN